jgi:hypothetical protein
MKTSILHIGVLDHKGAVHAVSFTSGVNVITGRSSTGKSALIEIFDYCFGSSDYMVPVGVITKHASLYFVVLKFEGMALVLAREPNAKRASLTQELDLKVVGNAQALNRDYFDEVDYEPLDDYKKKLRGYFNIAIDDVDTDREEKSYRKKKSSTPSVRSLTSFMLQHQNLVANKHAIFYRFDEKEKRDQVIEHLKIFLGFVDQTYFLKMQELTDLKRQARQLEGMIPRHDELKKRALARLKAAITEYEAASGIKLEFDAEKAFSAPKTIFKQVRKIEVELRVDSDLHAKLRQELVEQRSGLLAKLRKEQRDLEDIRSSIKYAEDYRKVVENKLIPTEATVTAAECPFCGAENGPVESKANELSQAIDWLNTEIGRSAYRSVSFEGHERNVAEAIDQFKGHIEGCDKQINELDQQIKDLQSLRSAQEVVLRAKLRLETLLEDIGDKTKDDLQKQLQSVQRQVKELNAFLKGAYDAGAKLRSAELKITEYMKRYGEGFDFEKSYKPINLRFDLETFDLCHVAEDDKVYLRSMGSGANWLSCHLTLFLGLHRYFCELGESCCIPPIIFFDQPSQVYFPSVLDQSEDFSAEDVAELEGDARTRPVDADVKAVSNMFSAMVKFCQETKEETGIEPQIIVTDHADHLELDGDVSFDDLVAGRRWRKKGEGFIKVEATEE